jgi:hypothetical protein
MVQHIRAVLTVLAGMICCADAQAQIQLNFKAGDAPLRGLDGAMGLETSPDMVEATAKGMVLRARSEPWGAKTGTYLYKKAAVGPQWTIETTVVMDSELLSQSAGIFVGSETKQVKFLIVRKPFGFWLYAADSTQPQHVPYNSWRQPLRLRLVGYEGKIWAFYSNNGKTYTTAGAVDASPLGSIDRFGICFVDDNPHKNETRIPQGSVPSGMATFAGLSFFPTVDASSIESLPRVFARITLKSATPAKATRLGVSVYEKMHKTLYLLGLGPDSTMQNFPANGKLPHDKITAAFDIGQQSQWMDWTPYFLSPRQQTVAVVSAWQEGLPAFENQKEGHPASDWGQKRNDGNVPAFEVVLELAAEPDESKTVRIIHESLRNGNLAIYFPDNEGTLAQWGPLARSMREYAEDRYVLYTKLGARALGGDSPFLTPVSVGVGYHSNYHDANSWQSEKKIIAMLGNNIARDSLPHPEWLWRREKDTLDPWDADYRAKFRAEVQKKVKQNYGDKPLPAQVVVGLGDEPGILHAETLAKSAPGLSAWHERLKAKGYSPEAVGAETWEQVLPVERKEAQSSGLARRYYEQVWFLAESYHHNLAQAKAAVHDIYGGGAIVTTDAYFAGFDHTPDYFLESRIGATDRFKHHFGGEHNYIFDIFHADMYRAASRFGQVKNGNLVFSCRMGQGDAVEQAGQLMLAHGVSMIYFYGYGPRATGWEWFSDDRDKVEAFVATSKLVEKGRRYVRYFAPDNQRHPKIATLLSRSASIWASAKENVTSLDTFGYQNAKDERERQAAQTRADAAVGWSVERNLIHAALNWSGYAVDVVPEEEVESGRLSSGQYQVLYVYEPNITRAAAEAVLKWVQAGGTVYIGAGAGTRDELNQPQDLLHRLTGNANAVSVKSVEQLGIFPQRGLSGEIWKVSRAYDENGVNKLNPLGRFAYAGEEFDAVGRMENLALPNASVLAKYADGSPAVVVSTVGNGRVVKAGTMLGAALARSAVPALNYTEPAPPGRVLGAGNVKRFCRRSFSPPLIRVLCEPARLANAARVAEVSQPLVMPSLFELPDGKGAVLFLTRYGAENETGKITVRVSLQGSYAQAGTFSGKSVAVRREGNQTVAELELGQTDVIEFIP